MRVNLQTLGCRLNKAEQARYAADFMAAGWEVVGEARDADVCVLHSCAVTRQAERESLRDIRKLKGEQRSGKPLIVLSGCVVACNDAAILHEAGADLLIEKAEAGNLVTRVLTHLKCVLPAPSQRQPTPHFTTKRALLRVQDGCDFNCAYCIVPQTRGAPASRPWNEVMREAEALIARGHQELVITGCNLACYRDGTRGLPELADALCRLPRVGRIRLGSVEPGTVEVALGDVMKGNRNLCRFLQLPIQSGDDLVLRNMGRRYNITTLRWALATLLKRVPNLSLGTDIITGLPGEDDAAFENTCQLLLDFPFSNLHVFPFSPRPGTRAAEMGSRPLLTVARERARILREIGDKARVRFAESFIGQPVQVLVEGRSAEGIIHGWSDTYLQCRLPDARTPIGTLTYFEPARVEGDVLVGA
jgi:threonylcarbamoyladenosine tRNA methylthiotransferase MtaB